MTEVQKAESFNLGCDARLQGRTLLACPYGQESFRRIVWVLGWRDVDQHWAELVDDRWPVRPLPVIGYDE